MYVFLSILIILGVCEIQTITNLEKWVSKQNYTFVLLTRDNCGYCDELEKELIEAEGMIKIGTPGSFGMPVVKIFNHTTGRFPSLRLYVKGEYAEYDGLWQKKEIESWVDNRVLSHVDQNDMEASIRWANEASVPSLVVFDVNVKQELKWIKMLRKSYQIQYTSLGNLAKQLLNVPEDVTAAFWTEKGLNTYYYEGEFDYNKVFQFIKKHERPYYQTLTETSYEQAFYDPDRPTLFLFDEKDNKEVAKTYQDQVQTIQVLKTSPQYDRLVNYLGIQGILHPLAVIHDQNTRNRKYRNQYKNQQELKQFLKDFQTNQLQSYLRTQSIFTDENWEKQILNVVTRDFPKGEEIFIYFYTQWCKQCQQINLLFEELFRRYKGQKAFGKINMEENDLEEQLPLTGVPHIRYYNQKLKKAVQYDGPYTIDALSQFVDSQGKRQGSDEL
ncbi:hypothetical protein pb186bvf_008853 [Paramecium bursaria]